jgi:glutamine---fructose-6-phosphate transaminase (isomerizing)
MLDQRTLAVTRFAYDDQLASMPAVVDDILARAEWPRLDMARPILFAGIGTSLHAARVAADWVAQLAGGQVRAFGVDAHDLGSGALPLRPEDQVVVISHRGKKVYPNASLRRARALGCLTISIVGEAAPEQEAAHTIRTCANETAGTFSVSYLASLAALLRIILASLPDESAAIERALPKLPDAIALTLKLSPEAKLVKAIAGAAPLLITGFASDLVTAQEAALKIKEGAWLWTEAMSPEFAIHGTPASFHAGMSAIVMLPASDDGGRTELLIDILKRLGLKTVATCGPVEASADLPFAAPAHPLLRPFLSILPFHLLTAELARLLKTDPDTLHGHREPWKGIMTGLTL